MLYVYSVYREYAPDGSSYEDIEQQVFPNYADSTSEATIVSSVRRWMASMPETKSESFYGFRIKTDDGAGGYEDVKEYRADSHIGARGFFPVSITSDGTKRALLSEDQDLWSVASPTWVDTSEGKGSQEFQGHTAGCISMHNDSGAAIARGELLVQWVKSAPHKCKARTSDLDPVLGVAIEDIADDDYGLVAVDGFCDVRVNSASSTLTDVWYASDLDGEESFISKSGGGPVIGIGLDASVTDTDTFEYQRIKLQINNGATYKNPLENGFNDRSESTLTFADANRRLTITPSGDEFIYYANGEKYVKSAAEYVDISASEGIHYVYYSGSTLASTTTFTTGLITDSALVAIIYWDATNSTAVRVADERHERYMDSSTHLRLHLGEGAVYASGLGLANMTTDGDGDTNSHCQLSVADGVIFDEDLMHEIEDDDPQDLSTIAEIPVFYRNGANGYWRQTTADDYPVHNTGTGRAAWNEWTGATWQLTEVTNNDLLLMHLFATNDIYEPIIAIMGQNEYGNAGQARTGAETEMGSLLYGEMDSLLPEFVPIGTIIVQTSDSYANAVQSKIITTDEGDDWIDFRSAKVSGVSATATDHGNMSGLDDDDHTQYSLADGTRAFTAVVTGVTPTADKHLATKDYVDDKLNVWPKYLDTSSGKDGNTYPDQMCEYLDVEVEGASVTAGELLSWYYPVSGTAKVEQRDTNNYTVAGIALDAGDDGDTIRMAIAGYCDVQQNGSDRNNIGEYIQAGDSSTYYYQAKYGYGTYTIGRTASYCGTNYSAGWVRVHLGLSGTR